MWNKTKLDDKVSCEDCKCWLSKDDAHVVEVSYPLETFISNKNEYYCQSCKPPYERKRYWSGKSVFYYRKMEVDIQGNPVGYLKIDTQKDICDTNEQK